MAFLWKDGRKTKAMRKNPSPTIQDGIPDPARDTERGSQRKSPDILRAIKGSWPSALLFKRSPAGMTVEASIVLPLCLFFLMNLGSAVEMIRLHNNLQLALWDTGSRVALYGFEQGGNTVASVVSGFYVKNRILDYVGENYLDSSPLARGSAGLQLWESSLLKQEDELDITLTYAVGPAFSLGGFRGFRMGNRYFVNLWNGYAIPGGEEETEIVYIAENGRVCHRDRNCTYLQLSVREISAENVGTVRNCWGSRYGPCEKCAEGGKPDILYVTEDGNCFHYRADCPGLKRTVCAVKKTEADGYPPCSRCGGG